MRTNKVILIAGTRGTGKTDFIKNLLAKMTHFDKRLVVDTFDSDTWENLETFLHPEQKKINVPIIQLEKFPRWKNGIGRIFSSDTRHLMELIQQHALNTFIVFEDATKYIGSRLTDDMKMFVLDSKQKNLDLVFIFHSLSQIPPDLIRVSDAIQLFKTQEGEPSKTKYPFPDIPPAMQRIRQHKSRYYNETIILQ